MHWLIRQEATLADFYPYDLSHGCAAWLVSAGVPLPEGRDLRDHSSIRVTERYAHLAPETVRAAASVLDGAALGHDLVTPEY